VPEGGTDGRSSIIWIDLVCGDREAVAVMAALNSVFQVVAFGVLGWFYLDVLPGRLGLPRSDLDISVWSIVVNVLIFLGIPLAAGFLTRRRDERSPGLDWYESTFLPRIGPVALYGLLFTVVILFASQGRAITARPGDVVRIAVPLGRMIGLGYERSRRWRSPLRAKRRPGDRDVRRHVRPGPGRDGRTTHRARNNPALRKGRAPHDRHTIHPPT
jgi:predicted Na+-dependent transporter